MSSAMSPFDRLQYIPIIIHSDCMRIPCIIPRYSAICVKSSAVAEMGDRLATIDMGLKERGCCAAFAEGAGPI